MILYICFLPHIIWKHFIINFSNQFQWISHILFENLVICSAHNVIIIIIFWILDLDSFLETLDWHNAWTRETIEAKSVCNETQME